MAHALKDKAEAAYVRTDLLERRRPLMDAWSEHCGGGRMIDPAPILLQAAG